MFKLRIFRKGLFRLVATQKMLLFSNTRVFKVYGVNPCNFWLFFLFLLLFFSHFN